MELKDIKTAPVEKKILLYWSHSKHIEDGTIYEDGNMRYHVLFDGESLNDQPSHWCEMPKFEVENPTGRPWDGFKIF